MAYGTARYNQNRAVMKRLLKCSNLCHHCGKEVVKYSVNETFHNSATIDHIYSMWDIRRYLVTNDENSVLSCNECNQKRNIEECAIKKHAKKQGAKESR